MPIAIKTLRDCGYPRQRRPDYPIFRGKRTCRRAYGDVCERPNCEIRVVRVVPTPLSGLA